MSTAIFPVLKMEPRDAGHMPSICHRCLFFILRKEFKYLLREDLNLGVSALTALSVGIPGCCHRTRSVSLFLYWILWVFAHWVTRWSSPQNGMTHTHRGEVPFGLELRAPDRHSQSLTPSPLITGHLRSRLAPVSPPSTCTSSVDWTTNSLVKI